MEEVDLAVVLERHGKWLRNEAEGACANLRYADLSGANLCGANLRGANLRDADLCGADLSGTDLRSTDLSGVRGLLDPIDYLTYNFEHTHDGIIAYKVFGTNYDPPERWERKVGSVLIEVVNPSRAVDCACGVNVATKDWIERKTSRNQRRHAWKVLIRWPWLAGVVVPYHTDGKIRCSRVELVEEVDLSGEEMPCQDGATCGETGGS